MSALHVEGVGKAYKTYTRTGDRFLEWLPTWPGRAARKHHSAIWVVEDIHFSVKQGEAVGILGLNGAGKSTLLKMIAGTVVPTTGAVHTQGRVSALLELGLGFHPDFTGRQNAHMAAQLLGLTSAQIAQLMPSIEAFAEIGDYINQPVRVYSSGMQIRLAFAVATALRPDVLIVDEALSVGDSYFQHKSFNRIREFKAQGTALLLVSHDKQAIMAVCDRAILLHKGRLVMQGEPQAVSDYYNAMMADHQPQMVRQLSLNRGGLQTVSGTGEVVITGVALLSSAKRSVEWISVGEAVRLEVSLRCDVGVDNAAVGFAIKDRLGQTVFGTNSYHLERDFSPLCAGDQRVVRFDFEANLGVGTYSVAVAIHQGDTHLERNFNWVDMALVFSVRNDSKPDFVGCNWMPVSCEVSHDQR